MAARMTTITETLGPLRPLGRWAARHRFAVQALIDCACWTVAIVVAIYIRADLRWNPSYARGLVGYVLLAWFAQLIAGFAAGLYRGRYRFGSFDEVAALTRAVVIASAWLFAVVFWILSSRPVPLSVTVSGGVIALVLMAGARYAWRLFLESLHRPNPDGGKRMLVFGAGEGGHQVVSAMMRDPKARYVPVGFLDDDPRKRELSISGVRVLGTRRDLAAVAARTHADLLLIAMPSAAAGLVSELTGLAEATGLAVKVLPSVDELYGAGVGVQDIRDLEPSDLLGRHQVETDIDSIAGYLTGKLVLVTGAGGSIGSELCRQISRYAPAGLLMLDRDESALHAVQLSIEGRALLDTPDLILGDIRDGELLERVFAERRPQVVFHAAALKHLPLLEMSPGEAVKTNVWGTLAVLRAAQASGVERFVNISTDKAADPISVLGYTKRIAERLTASIAAESDEGVYLSVRFGNVLGSRGSVLTTFKAQIDAGGPITVTDPEVTRYFMTVGEAVELVIQAGAIGRSGEALVLDMGEPVRIADVARRLAGRAERPIEIVFTGLRSGEKRDEVLLGRDEVDLRPVHPMISHVPVPPLAEHEAMALDPWKGPAHLIEDLRRICADQAAADGRRGP